METRAQALAKIELKREIQQDNLEFQKTYGKSYYKRQIGKKRWEDEATSFVALQAYHYWSARVQTTAFQTDIYVWTLEEDGEEVTSATKSFTIPGTMFRTRNPKRFLWVSDDFLTLLQSKPKKNKTPPWLMIRVVHFGHIWVGLYHQKSQTLEWFDSSGTYVGAHLVKRFLLQYLPIKRVSFINHVFLQDEDFLCQTWIYYYVYQRTIMHERALHMMGRMYALQPVNRFQLILAFSNFLILMPESATYQRYKFSPPLQAIDNPVQKLYMAEQHRRLSKSKKKLIRADLAHQLRFLDEDDLESEALSSLYLKW